MKMTDAAMVSKLESSVLTLQAARILPRQVRVDMALELVESILDAVDTQSPPTERDIACELARQQVEYRLLNARLELDRMCANTREGFDALILDRLCNQVEV